MEFEVVFITHKTVRKIAKNAKALARRIRSSQVQISAIDVITEFTKPSQLHKTFRGMHRKNRLARKQDKRARQKQKEKNPFKKHNHQVPLIK